VHARGKTLSADVDLEKLARRTPGFTGADLANLLNEAAILAARRNLTEISMDEINDAVDRVLAGPEKKDRLMSERRKELVAYHEAGYRARIRNHGHSCFLCEIVIRSQFHTTYEPEA
jgi:membrane protease FtsH catalytic subunit (EC 3.4.24.-)